MPIDARLVERLYVRRTASDGVSRRCASPRRSSRAPSARSPEPDQTSARSRALPRRAAPRRSRARVRVRGWRRRGVGALRPRAAAAALSGRRRARSGRRRARSRRFACMPISSDSARRAGERQSLFRYFHGRSSLTTWLRAVLAQRHVDRLRSESPRWKRCRTRNRPRRLPAPRRDDRSRSASLSAI